jgi:hypothetical protein
MRPKHRECIVLDDLLNSSVFILIGAVVIATFVVALQPQPQPSATTSADAQPKVQLPQVVVTDHRPPADIVSMAKP